MHLIHIKIFAIALLVFLITDMIWLGGIAKNLYLSHYKEWLRLSDGQLQPLWWSAIIVYLLFGLAVTTLIYPLSGGSALYAGLYGAILGFVIYGVYDFTCLAIIKDWPVGMAFVDWAWGTFLCGFSSMVTIWLVKL